MEYMFLSRYCILFIIFFFAYVVGKKFVGKKFHWQKYSSVKNIRHRCKNSSLFTDKGMLSSVDLISLGKRITLHGDVANWPIQNFPRGFNFVNFTDGTFFVCEIGLLLLCEIVKYFIIIEVFFGENNEFKKKTNFLKILSHAFAI